MFGGGLPRGFGESDRTASFGNGFRGTGDRMSSSCNLSRVVKCSTCGVNLTKELNLFDVTPEYFCTSCTDKETADQRNGILEQKNDEIQNFQSRTADQRNRILEQKNDEIQDLQSRLTFLRLEPVSESPEDIRKWDAVIVVQGRTDEPLHAHRFILSSKSHVFRTMFNVKMSEEETGIIYIDDATLPVIHAMIEFCYNAEIDFTDEVTAEEVLKVAHKYQIALLQTICEKHLIKSLNNSNLANTLRLAKKFDATSLEAAATKYFKSHFDQAVCDVLEELC